MDRPKLIRWLKISTSGLFGILCVLLIGLWIRSYSIMDSLNAGTSTGKINIHSVRSMIVFQSYIYRRISRVSKPIPPTPIRWRVSHTSIASNYHHMLQDQQSVLGFKYLDAKAQYYVVPYWFPVAVAAVLAFTPSVHWK